MISVTIYFQMGLVWLMTLTALVCDGHDTFLLQYVVTLGHLVAAVVIDRGTMALACWDARRLVITPTAEELAAIRRYR
jgi:hypothetical protein